MKKTPLPNRPGTSSRDGARPSGHGPTYLKGADGRIHKAVYYCACHGREFETKPIMQMHVRQYHLAVRREFGELVRTGNLGLDPWERLPGETALQYRRFQTYLTTTGPNHTRSVVRAASVMGTTYNNIVKCASTWHWTLRAKLWDAKVERAEFEAFEAAKRQSARRQANLGKKLQDLALAGANKLLVNEERLDEMSGNEIAKLADIGSKVERLANSDPTAISEDRGQVHLAWEGPKPSWAPAEPERPEPKTIEAGPLTQRVLTDGGR